jgi:hypothetical protein
MWATTPDFISLISFFFFFLSSLIFTSASLIFQSNHSICFPSTLINVFLLQLILFEIIYKIKIIFQIHPPLIFFHLIYLVLIFYCYFFNLFLF